MLEKVEIKHLRILDALFRCQNISVAAEHLNVSQQAVSLQLNRIRDILNDRLFVRAGHGVVPTPYAKQIEPYIQNVLIALKEIPLSRSISPRETERTLVISATDYAQKVIVGEMVKALRHSAPKVKILVIDIESSSLTKKMQKGEIDLVFSSTEYVPVGLNWESLFFERYLCVSANSTIKVDKQLPLKRLVDYDFIIASPGISNFKGSADSWFKRHQLHRNTMISVPSFFMAHEFLKQSDMIAFLPSRLLPIEGLFEIPLAQYPPGYEVVVAYHPNVKDDPFIMWLLDWLKTNFGE